MSKVSRGHIFGSPFSVKAGLFLHPLCICDATLEFPKLLYII